MPRTPEQGHTYKCLAKTMIAAIENYRDELTSYQHSAFNPPLAQSTLDYDFRLWAQDNNALHWAEGYLDDGTSDCICPDV